MNPLYNPILLARIAKSYMFDVDKLRNCREEDIRRYQDKQLRKIVKYAYKVPLYHKKYREARINPKDIRGIKDIEKLPLITKKDLRRALPNELIPVGKDIKDYHAASTSGSTGQPVTLYSDPYAVFKTFIGWLRAIKEYDINWRKTRMAIIADLSPDSAEEIYFEKIAMPSLRRLFKLDNIKAFHVGEKPEKLIKELEKFNPEFIGGYPGILNILAILKRQGKGKDLNPRCLASSGSVLDDYTRDYIRKTFNATIFDTYGATECSPMAFQCKKGKYHLHLDFMHMEFVDYREKESISGDGGNIIVTRLFGGGTPIIRYTGISDFLIPSKDSCNCGINTPTLDRIEGRNVDCIVLPDGSIVPPLSFTGIPHRVMHNLNTDKIQRFQIVQQSLTEVEILLIIDKNLREEEPRFEVIAERLKEEFSKILGPEVSVVVKEVDKILTNRPGAATPPPVVISKVKQPQHS